MSAGRGRDQDTQRRGYDGGGFAAPHEQLLLSSRQPSPRQVQLLTLVAVLLFGALLASLPFRHTPLPQIAAFIPVVDTMLLLGDLLTATLLFAQASVLRSRALMALATGYFFTALMIIPHALTFPGAFSETGLFGATDSTTPWVYFFWHIGFPVAVIAYACLKNVDEREPLFSDAVRPAIITSIAGSVLLATALTVSVTIGSQALPIVMADSINWVSSRVSMLVLPVLILVAVAMATVWRTRRSLLDLWLLLALWAWFIELLLLLTTSARYSGGWYMGRSAGLLSGVLVLLMLLWETNRTYARLALSVVTRRREREGQSITMNAVAASIAHEVKQPLNAIVMNAGAALIGMQRGVVEPRELTDILKEIASDGRRAANVVDSIRGMFRHGNAHRVEASVNDLIRETATMMSGELMGHQVKLSLELTGELPALVVDRLQIQHVLLNLFVNAIDAMSTMHDRPRSLVVRSSILDGKDVLISVQDSGIGIDADLATRIFEPFFTTKLQGTGMGLSLCRSIVEAHGGRLWTEPGAAPGATFHLCLPRVAHQSGVSDDEYAAEHR